ncbi:MAG: hypothetical protein IT539_10475 [Bradyrhizobiaceae bacterium]|nr:hypothetical protein [Bradyrhizobiaceae bacterium]
MRILTGLLAILLPLTLALPAAAQSKVKTDQVAPKANAPAATKDAKSDQAAGQERALPEVMRDLSRLPEKVRQMRERILEAARSGDLNKVVTVMQTNEMMPVFSFGSGGSDPVEYWKSNYPDSEGIEVLGILVDILETPFVHLDKDTPQEMYVWPYFYGIPLNQLTPEQKVELFRLVTGSDWREMQEFGAYIFFRVGISPSGVWHFFVAGD